MNTCDLFNYSTVISTPENKDQFNSIEKTITCFRNSQDSITHSAVYKSSVLFNISNESDIFSDLESEVFNDSQKEQMSSFMKQFRNVFSHRVLNSQGDRVFPKLIHLREDDQSDMIRMASTWDTGNVMMYLSFEKNEEYSSYGFIWNDNVRKNFESRTGSISLNDRNEIMHEICDFIFRAFG